MSRIRSQLDSILTGDQALSQTYAAPQPAYPNEATRLPQPIQQPTNYTNPPNPQVAQRTSSSQDFSQLQQSLNQLAGRINAIPRANEQSNQAQNNTGLQQVMLNEIRSGFQNVRQDLEHTRNSASPQMNDDLKRIADGIALLQDSQKLHPDYTDQMKAEFGNLQAGLGQLLERQDSHFDMSGISRSIESGYSEVVNKLESFLANRDSQIPINETSDYTEQLNSINQRIEEVTRAVISLTVTPPNGFDTDSVERIEARLSSLAKTVENFQQGEPIHSNSAASEMIANQIAMLSDKLDKLTALGTAGEQLSTGSAELSTVENRLAELADRFEKTIPSSGADQNIDHSNTFAQEILSVLRELVEKVEILENASPDTIADERFGVFENHLAQIAGQLDSFGGNNVDMSPISERLDNIENQISASRDIVIEIATEAAQKAAAEGESGSQSNLGSAAILEELRHLRQLNENPQVADGVRENSLENDHRLSEITASIGNIVSRLDEMQSIPTQQEIPAELPVVADSQEDMLDQNFSHNADQQFEEFQSAHVHNTPAMDMSDVEQDHQLEINQETDMVNQGGSVEPVEFDNQEHKSSEVEDVPLAPGSGMPDLEALVRRATQNKKEQSSVSKDKDQSAKKSEKDDNISDLMAAARRAAQAASAEAELERGQADKKTKKSKLPTLKMPAIMNKKFLMVSLAAVALAVGGVQLAPKLFGSNQKIVSAPASSTNLDSAAITNIEPSVDKANSEVEVSQSVTDVASKEVVADATNEVAETAPVQTQANSELVNNTSIENEKNQSPVEMALPAASGKTPPKEIGNALLINAAANGDNDALFEVGRRYTEGEGVERDLSKAVEWYHMAANNGHGPSQYRLGNFNEKGHGLNQDIKQAVSWYEMAAAQGNALAMHNLAVLNATGVVGGDADMPAAIEWFTKAAKLGVKDSQVNLGILYTKGMGVEENLEEAYKWFAIASKGGDEDAAKKRDTIAQAMRPEQLKKARGTAEIWKPEALEASANIAVIKDEWKSGTATKSDKVTKAQLIQKTQQLLGKAGYDAGPADGMMGDKTRDAIMAFQKENGISADGRITPELMTALSKIDI